MSAPTVKEESSIRRFSVATYNIHKCVGNDRKHDPDRIARVIEELDADIIGLQEVDSCGGNGNNGNGAAAAGFVNGNGHEMVVGPVACRKGVHYGNALLTTFPVLDVRHLDLSVPGREPRAALDVDLVVHGMSVRVIVAHLGLRSWERRRQVERIVNVFSTHRDGPMIVLGDFNEWMPGKRSLCRMHTCLGMPPAKRTFPSFFPVFPLDRVWVRPFEALEDIRVHGTALSRTASDHLPLKGTVVLDRMAQNFIGDAQMTLSGDRSTHSRHPGIRPYPS